MVEIASPLKMPMTKSQEGKLKLGYLIFTLPPAANVIGMY